MSKKVFTAKVLKVTLNTANYSEAVLSCLKIPDVGTEIKVALDERQNYQPGDKTGFSERYQVTAGLVKDDVSFFPEFYYVEIEIC